MGLHARDSRSRLLGVREFESHPLHHYGKIGRGFVLAMLMYLETSILLSPEDFGAFKIAHVLESGVHERARVYGVFSHF